MDFILANGKIINFMAKANFISKMAPIIKALFSRGLLLGRGGISIIMGVFMRGLLRKIRRVDMGSIMTHFRGISMRDCGCKMHRQVKVKKNFRMDLITKDNSKMESKMEKAGTFQTQAFMKDNLKMENLMEKGLLHILIIENTLEIGKMES